MKEVPYRMIRNEPGDFEETLSREGAILVSKTGKPFAIVLDAASDSLESAMRLVSQLRAQMAVAEMRTIARAQGLDRMTPEEIQTEINAVRASRTG
ncbi:MAG: hypothetical protein AABY97_06380 [Chloroflexota bacterium]